MRNNLFEVNRTVSLKLGGERGNTPNVSSKDTFDPFGSLGPGGDSGNLLGDWGNFSSAGVPQANTQPQVKITTQPQPSVREEKKDFFADFGKSTSLATCFTANIVFMS